MSAAIAAPRSARVNIGGCLVACVLILVAQYGGAAYAAFPAVCVLIALLLLGSGIGTLIGVRIRHPGHLLFVAIVSGLADSWSVTQPEGISQALSHEPVALGLLALPWPLLGTGDIAPLLGVGDVVFTALYVSATRAHMLPLQRTVLALLAGYVLTALCVVHFERPIPVLPWLGLCVLIAQPRARDIAAEDRSRGAWVLTVLAGALAVWLWRRSL